jgi:DNA (cytosine-5)-methyltransferase 1
MKSVELFTGAGGMALGIAESGFQHVAVVERDRHACDTLLENQRAHVRDMASWPVYSCDVARFDYKNVPQGVELLAAGVPCQPFSIGGKHRGHEDDRNMFPQTIEAIRRIKPKAVLIENVRGLTRTSFAKYFNYILLMISYPEIQRRERDEWPDHLSRLERYHTRGKGDGLAYRVVSRVLNAADFGVPQRRERVFIVGFRSDLQIEWSFPNPTHSFDSLLFEQYGTGEYWDRHKITKKARPKPHSTIAEKCEQLRDLLLPTTKAWQTVRDVICDLPAPAPGRREQGLGLSHFIVPGARAYVGHTGSSLDEPAKTLKAGDHGVPGGENMLAHYDGTVRYFTIRESARLQTFPDEYIFSGSWTESMRQLGNAVPVKLAAQLASGIRERLKSRVA